MERHVSGCATCREEWSELQLAWDALESVPEADPPLGLRARTLAAVAAVRLAEEPSWASFLKPLKFLGPALLASLASILVFVARDPDCRTPLAVACCGLLWAAIYALAFATLRASHGNAPGRSVAARSLLAAAGGILLVRFCPDELPGRAGLAAGLAAAAAASPAWAFMLGMAIAALPLVVAVVLIPSRPPQLWGGLATAGMYFAALAPALYLSSNVMALGGLWTLLTGAAVGTLGPVAFELAIFRGRAGHA